MFSKFFIDRPIFATVISLLIFIAGVVTYFKLPTEQFPDIVPPSVKVSCAYSGADAQTLAESVAVPIEKEVNGVDDMIYMTSTCSNTGSYQLNVYFEIGTNPDINTVNVMNRVNLAEPRLPSEVTQTGVTVSKQSPSMLGFYAFQLTEKAAQTKDKTYLSNYVSINVKDALARIHGVGSAKLMNSRDYSMRIWLDPNILAERNISVTDISNVLSEQNVQVASGSIGGEPAPKGQLMNLTLSTKGRLSTVEEFENLVVRTTSDGRMLKLKDIARIELDSQTYTNESFDILLDPSLSSSNKNAKANAHYEPKKRDASTIALYASPGANVMDVAEAVEKELESRRAEFESAGVEYIKAYDSTVFIDASLEEVKFTLILTIAIVVAVVYIFLQDWRAALIPSLTIPVSLVGTFFMMGMLGFTVNTLTLFGLCLVIGIVVDDAIVVVENCQRLLDEEGLKPYDAAVKSMGEVIGPVIATTCVLMAVFLPTMFMSGLVGRMYQQFALTIAGSVVISSLCALTIAPALCAILLRKSIPEEKKFIGFRLFNKGFNAFAYCYEHCLNFLTVATPITVIFWIALVIALVWGVSVMPQGFIPQEDQGTLFLDIRLPDARSLQQTNEVGDKIAKVIQEKFSGEVANILFVSGYSMLDSTNSSNVAIGVLCLKNWKERKGPGQEAEALSKRIMMECYNSVPEAQVLSFSPPAISGIGTSGGLEGHLIDKNESGLDILYNSAQELNVQGQNSGTFSQITSTFKPNYPRLYLNVDREKCKKMNVSLNELFVSLSGYLGSKYINDFNIYGRIFEVILQADGDKRATREAILSLPVMNSEGKKMPLSVVATIEETVGPQFITRYNMYTSASLMGTLNEGKSSGVGMSEMKDIAKNKLPEGFEVNWTGLAYQQALSGSSILSVFVLSLIFGFLVLAAQYESWSAPIIIIMAVPLGVSGAVLAVFLRGLDINMYTQIGLIVMVGLSAKNAILITEFARDKWMKEKHTILESARLSGRQRLRPIMMTSYAFILGVVPLMFATGAGAHSRIDIGTAVFGGMLEETMVGILVSPVLFIVITSIAVSIMSVFRRGLGGGTETSDAAEA